MHENEELTVEITIRDQEPIVLRCYKQTCQFFCKQNFYWSSTETSTDRVELKIWTPQILSTDIQKTLRLSMRDIIRIKIVNCPHTLVGKTDYGDMIFENVRWQCVDITGEFSVDAAGCFILTMIGDMTVVSEVMFVPYDREPENVQVISWADVFEKNKH